MLVTLVGAASFATINPLMFAARQAKIRASFSSVTEQSFSSFTYTIRLRIIGDFGMLLGVAR